MLKVLAISQGEHVPSARFRVRQYVEALRPHGVDLREYAPGISSYPPHARALRPAWGAAAVLTRLGPLLWSQLFDVTLVQREMISTVYTMERFVRRPRVFDVDDAIYLHRGGRPARALAQAMDAVICGNRHLQEWFGQFNSNTVIIPTPVDTVRFHPGLQRPAGTRFIGWSGTSVNLPELSAIEPALRVVLQQFPGVQLCVLCDRKPVLPSIPGSKLRFVRWTADAEVPTIQSFAVGIMPLRDTPWTRGKCSLKLLTYMACAVPVVASPVGMNADVLSSSVVGLSATTVPEWTEALISILETPRRAAEMGMRGRALVERSYSVRENAPQLARLLRNLR